MRLLFFISLFTSSILTFSQKDTLQIFFDFNEFTIKAEEKSKLDTLSLNNIVQINLQGYTDFMGSDTYNYKLSQERSNAVESYFLQKNIKHKLIKSCIGKGKFKPLNKIDSLRSLSRKVDILLTYKKAEIKKEPKAIEEVVIDTSTNINKEPIFDVNKVEVGDKLVIDKLYFIGGRHFLLPKSEYLLIDLLNIMKDNPTLKIELQGHICCVYNGDGDDLDTGERNLSIARAKAIYDFLIKNGIDASRLSYRGFGSSKRLPNTSLFDGKNRRVEILILDK